MAENAIPIGSMVGIGSLLYQLLSEKPSVQVILWILVANLAPIFLLWSFPVLGLWTWLIIILTGLLFHQYRSRTENREYDDKIGSLRRSIALDRYVKEVKEKRGLD